MIKISENAKKVLENTIGMPINQVCELNVYDENAYIKAITGRELYFSKTFNPKIIGRGNPLLARKKFTTIEEINKKIDALEKWR